MCSSRHVFEAILVFGDMVEVLCVSVRRIARIIWLSQEDMETLSAFLALSGGKPAVPGGFSSQRNTNAEQLWYSLWSYPEQTIDQTVEWLLLCNRGMLVTEKTWSNDKTVSVVSTSCVCALALPSPKWGTTTPIYAMVVQLNFPHSLLGCSWMWMTRSCRKRSVYTGFRCCLLCS